MAFNPDAYLAKKQGNFDPDAYLQSKIENPEASESNDALEKLAGPNLADTLRGYTSGATLGSQNILGGATQAGLDLAQSGLNKIGLAKPSPTQVAQQLKKQGTTGNIGPTKMDLYQQGKNETGKAFETSQERSPYLYGGAAMAGSAVPMSMLGTTPGALAGQGAASGLASSKSDIIGPDRNLLGAGISTAIGAGLGYGAGKFGQAFGKLSGAEAKALANKQAAKAVGLAPGFDKGAEAAGQSLLESGSLPTTGSQQTLNNAVQGAKSAAGQNIGNILGEIQPKVNDEAIQQAQPITEKFISLTDDFLNNSNLNEVDSKQVLNKAKSEYQRIAQSEGDVQALTDIKRDLQDLAKKTYGKNAPQQNTAVQNYYNKLASLVQTHVEDLANATEPELGSKLAEANAKYGPLKSAADKTFKAGKSEVLDNSGLSISKPIKSLGKLAGIKDPALLVQTASANTLNSPLVQGGAEVAGAIVKKVAPITNSFSVAPAAQGAVKSIYNEDNQKYMDYSSKLNANPNTAHLGAALDKAVKDNNSLAKTQALFVIQQNPSARKIISENPEGEQ